MPAHQYLGGCFCNAIRYTLTLSSPDDARTTLCHCHSCKKFTGGPFGATAKIPISSLQITQGKPKEYVSESGLTRKFCEQCGSGITERAQRAGEYTYLFVGTLDDPGVLPPKGEFFCKEREKWMPRIEGTFQKQELR